MARLPSWIEAYLVYTAESQSPELFHKWTAISAIAGVLQRRVLVDLTYFRYYPNMYVLLVAPAGRCRKSTAMRISRDIMRGVPGLQFSVDSTSRERLIRDMVLAHKDGQSALTAHSSEFASFFTTSGMNMVGFMTDIFDSPDEWIHRTEAGGERKIIAPCFNVLAGTTPDWLASAMPLDTVGIGLTSRIISIYQDTPRIKPMIPKLTPAQAKLKELLHDDLIEISTLNGQYQLTPEAYEWYDTGWGIEYQERLTHLVDPRLAGYYERKPTHLMKLSMAIAASFRNEMVITLEDMQRALVLLEEVEVDMPKVFAHVGRNPLAFDQEQVFFTIAQHTPQGGATMAQLLDKFKHNLQLEDMTEIIQSLTAMNRISLRNGRYYPLG